MLIKKKQKRTYELLKINILVTILILLSSVILFFLTKTGKDDFTLYNFYITGFLFFVYLFLLSSKLKKDIIVIKKEACYTNYNLGIITFLTLLFMILTASAICLITVNAEAANAAFIFTFFISTTTMIFPSILLIVFMYFIFPAFVIPGIKITKNNKNKNNKNIFLLFLLIIYTIFCIFKISSKFITFKHFEKQDKIKCSKLLINYSTDYLKFNNVSDYAKKLMANDKIKIPFFYTTNAFPYDDYDSAERFCKSLEARIPNYLELYHIIFNRFDTFGENYYWISDKDEKKHLVLHFKNMSYEIMKRPDNVKPLLYCVADTKDEMGFEKKSYFYHNFEMEKNETLETYTDKKFNFENLNDFLKNDRKEQKITEQQEPELLPFKGEKKHVNFSVKEVPPEIFEDLINSGYYYNPDLSISKDYETNDAVFSLIIRNNSDKIRLCFFPFTEYTGLNINQEKEIWQQSFCSPSFDLVNMTPVIKSQHEKDSYCLAYEGRVPNIPELNGILKTLGKNQTNVKYWVNTKVKDPYTNAAMPVLVYYKDSRFLNVKAVSPSENEQAYTYCIKKSKNPSSVIANYKSRFPNVEGYIYAKQQCQNCYYYEVPDTVLMK